MALKLLIEEGLPPVWIEGEVSNFTRHPSGHRYFTLKDEKSQIRCVMWREEGRDIAFAPDVGMKVLAYGKVSVYEKGGQYQFYASKMLPFGPGELQSAFERLKEKLSSEGLFDESRKRPIPPFPETVGVVTSPVGAAIRDIENVIAKRSPGVRIVLAPVRVQGDGAADEIARGIADLNEYGDVSVLIVGRGGGSAEDLWAFNEEVVARAIYASKIPVISAVGHEVDITVADLVADVRASTPSAAAQMAVMDRNDIKREIQGLLWRASKTIQGRIEDRDAALKRLTASYALRRFPEEMGRKAQNVDELTDKMRLYLDNIISSWEFSYRQMAGKLDALSPLSALSRGFSVCQKVPEGVIIRDSSTLSVEDRVKIRFQRGSAICSVQDVEDRDNYA